ncbi:MAG: prolyl oligopeptidase family serine peptidase [Gemmatimonadetes bacterium]|nr:prolyl oligopeptidase family serine peptidase [Gemmatimonadota bacterium]
MQFVDPKLPRHLFGWRSPSLGLNMPIVGYGHAGKPILLFPTAAADYLENERFFLVKALEPLLFAGRVRIFSIDSINQHAWMDRKVAVRESARRQALYVKYVEDEVVPYIRLACADGGARILTTGASFGAFHSANCMLRRPDLFDGLIAMSGFYDLSQSYFNGYSDDNCFYNNPAWFLPGLGGHYLDLLRHHCRILVLTGQGAYEVPDASRKLSRLLADKGIPHELDLWGHDVNHDWPWWRKMLPYAVERLGY